MGVVGGSRGPWNRAPRRVRGILALATLSELPYKTTLVAGRLDVGDAGIRLMGVLWLAAAAAFVVAAVAIVAEAGWALRLTMYTVAASFILCALGWPDSRLGVLVNVGLAVLLAAGAMLNVRSIPL